MFNPSTCHTTASNPTLLTSGRPPTSHSPKSKIHHPFQPSKHILGNKKHRAGVLLPYLILSLLFFRNSNKNDFLFSFLELRPGVLCDYRGGKEKKSFIICVISILTSIVSSSFLELFIFSFPLFFSFLSWGCYLFSYDPLQLYSLPRRWWRMFFVHIYFLSPVL